MLPLPKMAEAHCGFTVKTENRSARLCGLTCIDSFTAFDKSAAQNDIAIV